MADFNSGVQPAQMSRMPLLTDPVDYSPGNLIQAGGNILGAVGSSLMQGAQTAQVEQQTQTNNRALNNFQQNLLRISDLEQQGVFKSPDAALRHVRLTVAQALANNPSQSDAINKIYGNFIEKAGLGKNIADDYQRDKDNANTIHMAAVNSALSSGFIQPTDSPEQVAAGVATHQQYLFAQEQMNNALKVLQLDTAKVGLTNANLETISKKLGIQGQQISNATGSLNLQKAQAQKQLMQGAQGFQSAYMTKFTSGLNQTIDDVNSGKLNRDDAVMQVQQQLAKIHTDVSGLAMAHQDPSAIEALTKPIDMMGQLYIDRLSGKTTRTNVENTVANVEGIRKAQLLTSDNDFLTLTATTQLIPNGASAIQGEVANAAVRLLKTNGAIPTLDSNGNLTGKPTDVTNIPGDSKHNFGVDQYFNINKAAMKTSSQSKNPQLDDEIGTHLNNSLNSVGVYGPQAADPAELNSFIKYLGDPAVGQWIRNHPDQVNGAAKDKAGIGIEQGYTRYVLPLLQTEFINNNVVVGSKNMAAGNPALEGRFGILPGTDTRPDTQYIDMSFQGTGVRFMPKDNLDPNTNKASVSREAARLNAEVAPVINNLVRATAHLHGSNDYRSYYDQFMVGLPFSDANDQRDVKTSNQVVSEGLGGQ